MRFFTQIPDMSALTQLYKNYEIARAKYFTLAMQKSVESVKGAAAGGVPVATGFSRASMVTSIVGEERSIAGVVTSSARAPFLGPYIMNFGRNAGSQRPPGGEESQLSWWVERKGIGHVGQSLNEVVFLIARSIGKKGIKPLRFMIRALGSKTPEINQNFRNAVESIVKELESNGH